MGISIRPFTSHDAPAVYHMHEQAFDGRDEANLVQALHDDGAAVVSLIAESDGMIVGHILYTSIGLTPAPRESRRIVALAPLAVLPPYQRSGVGSSLMKESLVQLRARGFDGVIVLGHPEYYPPFGFRSASAFGLEFPGTVPANAFMALPLHDGALAACAGTVVYHPAFGL